MTEMIQQSAMSRPIANKNKDSKSRKYHRLQQI